MLLAGHAQVHVGVDEAREEVLALAVDDFGVVLELVAQLGDPAVADEHVEPRVDARARVEHVGAADQDVGGRGVAVVEVIHAGTGVERLGCGAERPASSS